MYWTCSAPLMQFLALLQSTITPPSHHVFRQGNVRFDVQYVCYAACRIPAGQDHPATSFIHWCIMLIISSYCLESKNSFLGMLAISVAPREVLSLLMALPCFILTSSVSSINALPHLSLFTFLHFRGRISPATQ